MVLLEISTNANSFKRNELLSAFHTIAEQIRLEEGCLGCRISQDIENENQIYLVAFWKHRSHLDAHFRSDIFGALLGSAKFLGKTHELQIYQCSHTDGVEAVQSVRS